MTRLARALGRRGGAPRLGVLAPALCAGALVTIGCALIDPIDAIPAGNGVASSVNGGANSGGAGSAIGGASASFGGSGGTLPEIGGSAGRCSTNADCGPNSRCLPAPDQVCVRLDSGPCWMLINGEKAGDPKAIFIGAFAPLELRSDAALSIPAIYEMAAAEFNEFGQSGGLRDPHGGPPSPLVVVVCNNTEESTPRALHHLIDEVRVPAVLAAMDPAQLVAGFNSYPQTFFVSAFNGSKALAQASDGRAWTMLGLPSDYADIYGAIMPHVEALAHAALRLNGEDRELRVAAVIEAKNSFEQELADAVLMRVGLDAEQPDRFLQLFVASTNWTDDPTVLARLSEQQPDIVFSFAGDVFTSQDDGVMSRLNQGYWSGERPVYILSPENAVAGDDVRYELNRLRFDDKNSASRVLGIGAAGLPPGRTDALITFKQNLANYFPSPIAADFNNYYDAFYFLVDSIYASPRRSFFDGSIRASDLTLGIKRLTVLGAKQYDIGPGGTSAVFDALDEPSTDLQLYGTMGAPDFDRNTGMRRESGSVYCFDSANKGIHPDTIGYNRETATLTLVPFAPCLINFLSQ